MANINLKQKQEFTKLSNLLLGRISKNIENEKTDQAKIELEILERLNKVIKSINENLFEEPSLVKDMSTRIKEREELFNELEARLEKLNQNDFNLSD